MMNVLPWLLCLALFISHTVAFSHKDVATCSTYQHLVKVNKSAIDNKPVTTSGGEYGNSTLITVKFVGLAKSGTTWLSNIVKRTLLHACNMTDLCENVDDAEFLHKLPGKERRMVIYNIQEDKYYMFEYENRHSRHQLPYTKPAISSIKRASLDAWQGVEPNFESDAYSRRYLMPLRDPRDAAMSWADWIAKTKYENDPWKILHFVPWYAGMTEYWYKWQACVVSRVSPTWFFPYNCMRENPLPYHKQVLAAFDLEDDGSPEMEVALQKAIEETTFEHSDKAQNLTVCKTVNLVKHEPCSIKNKGELGRYLTLPDDAQDAMNQILLEKLGEQLQKRFLSEPSCLKD